MQADGMHVYDMGINCVHVLCTAVHDNILYTHMIMYAWWSTKRVRRGRERRVSGRERERVARLCACAKGDLHVAQGP